MTKNQTTIKSQPQSLSPLQSILPPKTLKHFMNREIDNSLNIPIDQPTNRTPHRRNNQNPTITPTQILQPLWKTHNLNHNKPL